MTIGLGGILAIALAFTISAATAANTPPPKPAAKRCDTTKIYTGPRGGKYHYTASCKKVYIKK